MQQTTIRRAISTENTQKTTVIRRTISTEKTQNNTVIKRAIFILFLGVILSSALALAGQRKSTKHRPATRSAPASANSNNTDKDAAAKNEPGAAHKEAAPVAEPKAKARAEDQWALLVGISDYPGQIQKLQFPRNDAIATKDLLISAAGFPEDHIKLLTDNGQGDSKATKQNILAAVDYLAQHVQPGHQVIVLLAGHGIVRGLGYQAKGYFLPVDVDASSKEALERTGLDLQEFSHHLSALKAKQFTMFIDACREDPFPGRGIKGNTMTDVMSRSLRVVPAEGAAPGKEPPTSVAFYACQIGERAFEDPKLGHGVFTYYVLKGITDLANRPDGRVEAGYLAAYLKENVQKWSAEFARQAKYPVEQTPTMVATDVRGPLVIVRLASLAKDVPAPSKGGVVLDSSPTDAKLFVDGQAIGTGPVQKELAPGEHTVRAELQGFQAAESKLTIVPGVEQEVSITLNPVAANPNYEKGVKFESQQLWPQAIASYEMAMQDDPNAVAPVDRLANAYIETVRYRDAVDLLTTATEKWPDNTVVAARRVRALCLWALDDQNLDASTNSRPGKAVKQTDARKEAVRAAEQLAQKAPGQAESQLALGYAYDLEEKTQQKALSAFVRASTIEPDDAEGYYGVGYTYRLLKKYDQAIPQLKKALELRPEYYEAHRELAYCYHATGDKDDAIKEYNNATGYQGETNNSGEMAGNHLALSALYTEKGQEVGGSDGEEISKAGKAHETEARGLDPTLKAALKILTASGVSGQMTRYLPPEVQSLINTKSVSLPGGIKVPFGRKRP
jgi:tetratricopeptide (TPR) repeat protein